MESIELKTFIFNELLSDDQIEKYETSNSILVSTVLFQTIMNNHINDKNMLILGLYNNKKKIYVNIDGSHHNDDNIIYVPLWIYQYLKINNVEPCIVSYMQVSPKSGNKIKIKPHSDFYAYLPDPVKSLRDGFERYSILLKNTTIPVNVDGQILLIDIVDTFTKNQPINIRGVELEVEIEDISNLNTHLINPDTTHLINPDTTHLINPDTTHLINPDTTHLINPDTTHLINPDDDFSSMIPSINSNRIFPGKGYSLK